MQAIKYIVWFIAIVLAQTLLFNNIFFAGYLNPYIYLIFILFLPVNTSRVLLLIASFILGWCIDIFENSGGVHIAASVVLGFVRPYLLKLSIQRQESEIENLQIQRLPILTYSIYTLLAIFIHHLILFTIEAFSFSGFGTTLLRTLYSSLFTFLFILVVRLWNFRRRTD